VKLSSGLAAPAFGFLFSSIAKENFLCLNEVGEAGYKAALAERALIMLKLISNGIVMSAIATLCLSTSAVARELIEVEKLTEFSCTSESGITVVNVKRLAKLRRFRHVTITQDNESVRLLNSNTKMSIEKRFPLPPIYTLYRPGAKFKTVLSIRQYELEDDSGYTPLQGVTYYSKGGKRKETPVVCE